MPKRFTCPKVKYSNLVVGKLAVSVLGQSYQTDKNKRENMHICYTTIENCITFIVT